MVAACFFVGYAFCSSAQMRATSRENARRRCRLPPSARLLARSFARLLAKAPATEQKRALFFCSRLFGEHPRIAARSSLCRRRRRRRVVARRCCRRLNFVPAAHKHARSERARPRGHTRSPPPPPSTSTLAVAWTATVRRRSALRFFFSPLVFRCVCSGRGGVMSKVARTRVHEAAARCVVSGELPFWLLVYGGRGRE